MTRDGKTALLNLLKGIMPEEGATAVEFQGRIYCWPCLQTGKIAEARHVRDKGYVCSHCRQVRFVHTPTCLGSSPWRRR